MAMSRTARSARWMPWLAAALLVALLCGLLTFWLMQLLSPPVTIAPTGSLVSDNSNIDTGSTRLLFGSENGAAPVKSTSRPRVNVKVIGVAAGKSRSAAIHEIDGKPAQAFAEGETIDDDLVIKSVTAKKVVLEQDGEPIEVEVPAQQDLAILTAGDTGEGPAATPTGPASRPAVRPNGRSNVRPATRPTTGRPALAPRRLPPSGAAAAAAASRNTTGVATPNTPNAARRSTPGRPQVRGALTKPAPNGNQPAPNQPATAVNSSSAVNGALTPAQSAARARINVRDGELDGEQVVPDNQAQTPTN